MEEILDIEIPQPNNIIPIDTGGTFLEWDVLEIDLEQNKATVTILKPFREFTFILPLQQKELHQLIKSVFPYKTSKAKDIERRK